MSSNNYFTLMTVKKIKNTKMKSKILQYTLIGCSVMALFSACRKDPFNGKETKEVMRSGNWPRRADVYTYLYDSDTLLLAVMNLTTGQVDSVETMQNVQLPLTQKRNGPRHSTAPG